jgi:hypothetical protein
MVESIHDYIVFILYYIFIIFEIEQSKSHMVTNKIKL